MRTFLALLVASALLVENVYPWPLALMGLGMGFPFMGLGMMGLGWGMGLGRVGLRRFGHRRFGREADVLESQAVPPELANKTLCSYESDLKILQCASMTSSFDCQVEERMPKMENIEIRLADMELAPAKPNNFDVIRILSRASSGLFTFIQPGTTKQVTLSLFNSEKVNQPGLLIKDELCWSQIQHVVSKSNRDDVGFALAL
ncbi:hypothetical protein BpHYR1_028788 [Brachionus plicatilis]|uniref:Uncharacterized protein n=1 Tax=Brachionus plicatilis TaxID=10195 RepID=A0A3M7RCD9_BRAPC|nr:hypothetical protein BpHYR1_028788 [Brachionus plicatilis]